MAIVGAGPIGLAALLTAQFYSPAEIIMIDLDDNRLEMAKRFGATATINSSDGKAVEKVMKMTGGRGVDTAIEAVGIPATFVLCEDIVAPGGTIANIGVHGSQGRPASGEAVGPQHHDHDAAGRHRHHADAAQDRAIRQRSIRSCLITHRFKLDKILDAYDTFGRAASTRALKVLIEA